MEHLKRLLVAASPSIPDHMVLRHLSSLPSQWDGEVLVLEGNAPLRNAILERRPDSIAVKAKGPVSFRKLISGVSHLFLMWDGEDLSRLLFEARLQKITTKLIPVSLTRVVNKKTTSDFDVYIGRGTPWGNPYAIAHGGEGPDRAEVISQYRSFFNEKILSDSAFKTGILAMRGLRLACFCKPEACHGDVIANYLNVVDDSYLKTS